MKAEQNISSYREAKQIDLVDYLSTLGFKPAKIRGNDYWYLSPLRDEKTPSFKIDRKINCWYDHGMGKGGNLINFGMAYFNCNSAEFLQRLNGKFFLHQPVKIVSIMQIKENKLTVLNDFVILDILIDIAKGLNYMYENNIVHLNVNPENILVSL